MRDKKILFTGTPGAGKTTAITALSDAPPVLTDVVNTDASLDKAYTTVGLDFGMVDLGSGNRLRLFGTPGQARFEFMWRILAKEALAIIILVDNRRPVPLADLGVYLDAYSDVLPHTACVVGIGHTESRPRPTLDAFADQAHRRGLVVPVLPVDVRRRDDVLMLLDTALSQAELHGRYSLVEDEEAAP